MPFSNPILGGSGALIRPAIHSPDYVAGVQGWSINKDGTVEFNDGVFRGDVTVNSLIAGTVGGERLEITSSGVLYIYDTNNDIIAVIDSDGLQVNHPASGSTAGISAVAGQATSLYNPGPLSPHAVVQAAIFAQYFLSVQPSLSLRSPTVQGRPASEIHIVGESVSGTYASVVSVLTDIVRLDAGTIRAIGDLVLGNDSLNVRDMLTNEDGINAQAVTSGTNTTTSASYANLGGTGSVTSFPFTKLYDGATTRLRIRLNAAFHNTANNAIAEFGVLINGVDYPVTHSAPGVGPKGFPNGTIYITGLAAGAYTVQGRWRRSAGTGTCTRDVNDWLTINAKEVPV